MSTQGRHWTERSVDDFVHKISSDFVVQLEKKMDAEHITPAKLAQSLGVSPGRVSQVLNDPGNLTLKNCVRYARCLGMKAALVAYEDGDAVNSSGPINSELFYRCWQRNGSPRDFFELAERSKAPVVIPVPGGTTNTYLLTITFEQSGKDNTRRSLTDLDLSNVIRQQAETTSERKMINV